MAVERGFNTHEFVKMRYLSTMFPIIVVALIGCQPADPIQKLYTPVAKPSDDSIEVVSFKVNGVSENEALTVAANSEMKIELTFIRNRKPERDFSVWNIYAELEKDIGEYLAGSVIVLGQRLIDLPKGSGELTFRHTIPVPPADRLVIAEKEAGEKLFHFAIVEDNKIVVSRKINYTE